MKIYRFGDRKNISGERIREARLRRRLTQTELAARLQVEGVIIPDYEIPVFARVLGVSELWLLGIDE